MGLPGNWFCAMPAKLVIIWICVRPKCFRIDHPARSVCARDVGWSQGEMGESEEGVIYDNRFV